MVTQCIHVCQLLSKRTQVLISLIITLYIFLLVNVKLENIFTSTYSYKREGFYQSTDISSNIPVVSIYTISVI